MNQTFNIQIVHGLDDSYVGYEFAVNEIEVDAKNYEDAIELAEKQYFAEHPEMQKQVKKFGISFYQN